MEKPTRQQDASPGETKLVAPGTRGTRGQARGWDTVTDSLLHHCPNLPMLGKLRQARIKEAWPELGVQEEPGRTVLPLEIAGRLHQHTLWVQVTSFPPAG